MADSMPSRSFCVQARQLTATVSPDLACTLSVIVPMLPRPTTQLWDLRQVAPSTFSTRDNITFQYASLSDCLEFSLLAAAAEKPAEILARVKIPLQWFPPDAQVAEAFHMRPLGDAPSPILFLSVQHNCSASIPKWEAPYGVIEPRRAPAVFGADSVSMEFIASGPVRGFSPSGVIAEMSVPPRDGDRL
jgi:hypothetical protein